MFMLNVVVRERERTENSIWRPTTVTVGLILLYLAAEEVNRSMKALHNPPSRQTAINIWKDLLKSPSPQKL